MIKFNKPVDVTLEGIKLKGTLQPKGYFVRSKYWWVWDTKTGEFGREFDREEITDVMPTVWQKIKMWYLHDSVWISFK